MSQAQELMVMTAFGSSAENALILAVQPAEWGNDKTGYRTFAFRLRNKRAQYVETLSDPVACSWLSTSGTAYCPTCRGSILTFQEGRWDRSRVCEREERLGVVWGIPGDSAAADQMFVCSNDYLHIRNEAGWREVPLPETCRLTNRIHGLSPDEIYFATGDGLIMWDGSDFVELERPNERLFGVLVLSEHELIATGDFVHRYSDSKGWKRVRSPTRKHAGAITTFGHDIYIPSLDGVLRLRANSIEKVLEFRCNRLFSLGDALLASGRTGCHLFDGQVWTHITLPLLNPGESPR